MKAKTDSTKKKKKTDTGQHKVVFGLDVDRSSMLSLSALLLTQIKPRDISQHIAAWGWNSNQRCGHINAVTIPQPRQIQHSKVRNYIDCSAGRHHSLFLSEHGIVFSIGDGRKGQLGYGNLFSPRPKKGGVVQAIPQAITPTGNLKFGRDLQCMQVSAGGTFSMAREATPYEGARVVQGFLPLEQVLEEKLRRFPDSNSLREVWSYVRQERFMINKRADGLVITWGTGKHGELGLGDDIKFAPYPMVNFRLKHVCISKISAGDEHALAIDSQGRLYSWGRGGNGRLGHGDFEDRNMPQQVLYFKDMIVVDCSAGDRHSAVLTIARQYEGDEEQYRKVFCFGRGAHGRLGNGTNRNQFLPVMVKDFPPSVVYPPMQFHQIVCGGAHTLLLAARPVERCLAFPFGIETCVLGWGYGGNGQLGTGYREDSFVPVKCRTPKSVIIVEIGAGRSWSIARTIGGVLYSWGKGMRGQLGQSPQQINKDTSSKDASSHDIKRPAFRPNSPSQKSKGQSKVTGGISEQLGSMVSLAPRVIETFGSFVKIQGGYAHSVGIYLPKKELNLPIMESKMNQQVKEEGVTDAESTSETSQTESSRQLLTSASVKIGMSSKEGVSLKKQTDQQAISLKSPIASSKKRSAESNQSTSSKKARKSQATVAPLAPIMSPGVSSKKRSASMDMQAAQLITTSLLAPPPPPPLPPAPEASEVEMEGNSYGAKALREIFDPLTHSSSKLSLISRPSLALHQFHCCHRNLTDRDAVQKLKTSAHKLGNLSAADTPSREVESFFQRYNRYTCDTCKMDNICYHCLIQCHLQHSVRNTSGHPYLKKSGVPARFLFPRKQYKVSCRELFEPKPKNVPPSKYFPVLNRVIEKRKLEEAKVALRKQKSKKGVIRSPNSGSPLTVGKKSMGVPSPPSMSPSLSSPGGGRSRKGMSKQASLRKSILAVDDSRDDLDLPPFHPKTTAIPACHCSLYCTACHVLPAIEEDGEEKEALEYRLRIMRLRKRKDASVPVLMPSLPEPIAAPVPTPQSKAAPAKTSRMLPSMRQLLQPSSVETPVVESPPIQQVAIGKVTSEHINKLRVELEDDHITWKLLEDNQRYLDKYASKIQAWGRRYVCQINWFELKRRLTVTRRKAVKQYYHNNILGPVFAKFHKAFDTYREEMETNQMMFEEDLIHRFEHHKHQQGLLLGMRAVQFGLRYLVGKASIPKPFFPPKVRGHWQDYNFQYQAPLKWYPSFAFSYESLRDQVIRCHPVDRFPSDILGQISQYYPRQGKAKSGALVFPPKAKRTGADASEEDATKKQQQKTKQKKHVLEDKLSLGIMSEGRTHDPDVNLFFQQYIHDANTDRRLFVRVHQKLQREEARYKAVLMALDRLKSTQRSQHQASSSSSLALRKRQQAASLGNKVSSDELRNVYFQQLLKWQQIFPTKISLSDVEQEEHFRALLIEIDDDHPFPEIALALEQAKRQGKHQLQNVDTANVSAYLPIRRHSVGSAMKMYQRCVQESFQLPKYSLIKRRQSLPSDCMLLASIDLPIQSATQRQSLNRSLHMFSLRRDAVRIILKDFREEKTNYFGLLKHGDPSKAKKKPGTVVVLDSKKKQKKSGEGEGGEDEEDSDSERKSKGSKGKAAMEKQPSTITTTTTTAGKAGPPSALVTRWQYDVSRVKKLFATSMCAPRLPLDINTMLLNPMRRRSVGEPERLFPQLSMLMDYREDMSNLVELVSNQYKLRRRRRSFDYYELKDEKDGMWDLMALDLEYNNNVITSAVTVTALRKDSILMDERMLNCGYLEATPELVERIKRTKAAMKEWEQNMKKLMAMGGNNNNNSQPDFIPPVVAAPTAVTSPKNGVVAGKGASSVASGGSVSTAKVSLDKSALARSNSVKPTQQEMYDDQSSLATMDNYQQLQYGSDTDSVHTTSHYPHGYEVEVWQEHFHHYSETNMESEAGPLCYYYNVATGESRWDKPIYAINPNAELQFEVMQYDEGAQAYYWFNTTTGATQWV